MARVEIKLEDETDRWQWTCPAGHRGWEPTNNHFWCAECARNSWDDDVEPEFDQLRNEKTGDTVDRKKISLITPVGPYEGR
jgi:hypothetical protein